MPDRRRTLLRNLTAAVHRAAGRFWFRFGAHERARQHFERLLELCGDDFGAYVHLARIAYRRGEYASWQRECGHARRTDPLRYARLGHPFELFDPRTGAAAGEARILPPSLLPYRPARRGVSADRRGEVPDRAGPVPAGPGGPGPARATGDDFTSREERERFAALGPIEAGRIAALDIDALLAQLVATPDAESSGAVDGSSGAADGPGREGPADDSPAGGPPADGA
jgi:hypothetical protein